MTPALGRNDEPVDRRAEAKKLFDEGNYLESMELSLALLRGQEPAAGLLVEDWVRVVGCLAQLQRNHELDGLVEEFVKLHAGRWEVVHAIARTLLETEHYGFVVAGKFNRGQARGGGQWTQCTDRDRSRALQLLVGLMPLVSDEGDGVRRADFFRTLSEAIVLERSYGNEWRLQELTDLTQLPELQVMDGYGWGGRSWGQGSRGAPVDAEGNPVFYNVPTDWASAASDGERWRWALAQEAASDATRSFRCQWEYVDFLHRQFGVQSLQNFGINLGSVGNDEETGEPDLAADPTANPLALRTLEDHETIARLATGVRRFRMPDEHNPILLAQKISLVDDSQWGGTALEYLAGVHTDRQQYVTAAADWQKAIQRFGETPHRKSQLSQIVDPWGMLENTRVSPAGEGAALELRFRNAREVTFTAQKIDQARLIADTIRYLGSNPVDLDWEKFQLQGFGQELIERDRQKYVGEKVAEWTTGLEPRNGHMDRRTSIRTPLQEHGAYLVTARIKGGNTTRIVVWIDRLAIVKKAANNQTICYVANAVDGSPVPGAELDFFGWSQQWNDARKRSEVLTKRFAEKADASGLVTLGPDQLPDGYQWLIAARTRQGDLAWMGYTGAWSSAWNGETPTRNLAYLITDRPIYRPGQKVEYRIWLREASYRPAAEMAKFAGQSFEVVIVDPMGKEVRHETVVADAAGSVTGTLQLDEEATLGAWTLSLINPPHWGISGSLSFRVEEYKKPEYEVKVEVPDAPVKLGETITATVAADYYFGGAVTNATVHYKVHRTARNARWFPVREWDWLYGNGYWWFAADSTWYRGFDRWGCFGPLPPWWGGYQDPPELVLEEEARLGPDGKLQIQIDTQLAKALHGDQDHEYSITAEVVDASRRTIVGSGSVTVARQPFRVYAWTDRGYANQGESFTASFSARTPGGEGVVGKASVELFQIRWKDRETAEETSLQKWEGLDTDASGNISQEIQASQTGQFRIVCKVDDGKGNVREGAQLFTIRGDGFDGKEFRFNDLEVTVDRAEYKPGEKVRLMINTDRPDSTVLLWIRPVSGVYAGKPEIVTLKGKSTIHEIEVSFADMPNFYVEATTISSARVHEVVRNIVVPPMEKSLKVSIEPTRTEWKPGEQGTIKLRVTDATGEPVVGDLVLTMYDRAIEYISGGTNVPDIRETFWKWTRAHYPNGEHSLNRYFGQFTGSNEASMAYLGVFGYLTADQNEGEGGQLDETIGGGPLPPGAPSAGGSGGRGGGMVTRGMALAMDAAPMAEAMEKSAGSAPASGAAPAMAPVTVRSNFADSAIWQAAVTTSADGTVELPVTMPENLTSWKIRSWAMGPATSVGEASVEVTTKKNILVRLQAPRFFVERDEIVLSAIVHNYLEEAKQATVRLVLEGGTLSPVDGEDRQLTIPAGGEVRVDWRVTARAEGMAAITMSAETDVESDAMRMEFPVYVHGMLKTDSWSSVVRVDQPSTKFEIVVPEQRRPEQTRLEIRYSPTLAGAMVDALPYLVDYPYGCTEQTLNRFVPTAVTLQILRRMNLDLDAIRTKRTNLNAQQIGDPAERAKQWQALNRNPVFDPVEVEKMAKQGIADLTAMQCQDGGWGWFSGAGERSWPHTTAVVVHGLQTAAAADLAIPEGILAGGLQWLTRYQDEQVALLDEWERLKDLPADKQPAEARYKTTADNLDALVHMVLVDGGVRNDQMTAYLYRDRTRLTLNGLGLLGLALDRMADVERRDMVLRNMDQFVVEDPENQTAFIDLPNNGGSWWYWYGDTIEANAWYLKLMSRVRPQDPRTAGVVKYLLNNRRVDSRWNSTRDTATVIEALAEYLVRSGEAQPDMTVEVLVDGKVVKTVAIDAANLFDFDGTVVLEGEQLSSGPHQIELRRSGKGPLYVNAYLTNFTLEDHIPAAGLEVKVNRKIYRLVPRKDAAAVVQGARGEVVEQKVEKYDRVELAHLGEVASGDLVEVELEIDSKNDYEYVIFEDFKAAGFEPVDLRSGYTAGGLGAYVEYRDERAAFFMRSLARGKHSVSYRLRAEVPGKFSALPARAWAMYAPELKGNSEEIRLLIGERPEEGK